VNGTPVWLLDIDGVINAVSYKPPTAIWPEEAWQADHAVNDGTSYRIHWAHPVIDFIKAVHESGRAEIRWHTTWQHQAQTVADLVGLPVLPVADAPEFYGGSAQVAAAIRHGGRASEVDWWKLGAALRVTREEGRPLIWTDDDMADALWHSTEETFNVGTIEAPALMVCPNVYHGLSPRDLGQIELFLHDLETNR